MIAVVGLGAGGHAAVVIDLLRRLCTYEVVGLLDPSPDSWGMHVMDVPVLGDDSLLPGLLNCASHVFIGVGSIGDSATRRRLFQTARRLGFAVVSATHPTASLGDDVSVGAGTTIMAAAVVNARSSLGDNVIVNSAAVVEHDCVVGAHVHIASRAVLGGSVRVGDEAHVGLGAVVLQGRRLGKGCLVGAGAVVTRDVEERMVVTGIPARPIRSR